MLQRFSAEKDLIEVVAAKEKDINVLKREVAQRDEELSRRQVELETAHSQYDQLDKQFQLETLQAEMRERNLYLLKSKREVEIENFDRDLDWAVDEIGYLRQERDARLASQAKELREYQTALVAIESRLQTALENAAHELSGSEFRLPLLWEALLAERSNHQATDRAWAEGSSRSWSWSSRSPTSWRPTSATSATASRNPINCRSTSGNSTSSSSRRSWPRR